ncbi:hypothetical protein C479_11655 [Halovivax asiaticus JCM 14624]|uniref:Uncharacterized protein n=1 Tax=Halovivax asiaticus JCM 14624 TaxID=1227490 RepID=M0BF06_9EURY|nr:hypothetical protein [Halovivax asiaticus]ELZ09471.1 hypothetical protein C479_11655 [Halovivax asiaticus JCM 14624]
MVAATLVAFLFVSLAAFLCLWWLIERETADPPVMDRGEAERRAIEQGGRGTKEGSPDDRPNDERDDGVGWD